MGLIPNKPLNTQLRTIFMILAAAIPFVCYLATASAYFFWLDAGEFVAGSINLGIAHPPGQPLSSLIGRLFAMIPLGPLSLRVAIASAAMSACAALALYCSIETTIRSMGVHWQWVVFPTALGVTWFIAGSFGWWFQAVRPEVYALQAALTCLVLERLIYLEAVWPTLDVRPLITIAFTIGLALANHHFLAILIFPAIMPTAARVLRTGRWKPFSIAIVSGILGLSVYIYLPLRAAINPVPNLGEPSDLSRFFWVVSAQAFQKNTGSGVPQLMSERYLDIFSLLIEDLHIYCPVAVVGLYCIMRTAGARRIGLIWMLIPIANIIARAWLGFVQSNPDAYGYLLPSYAAIGAFFAVFVAVLVRLQEGRNNESPSRSALIIAHVVLLLGLAQIYHTAPRASLENFRATDEFDDSIRRSQPTRAVLILYSPQSVFLFWGGEGQECIRPDLTLIPVPFLFYPGTVEHLIEKQPELKDLLRGYVLNGQFSEADLQTLAGKRPVIMEMDISIEPSLYQTIIPAGLTYRVLADGATRTDEQIAAESQRKQYRSLYKNLGTQRLERNTSSRLLWLHFTDALYFMGFGDRLSAQISIKMAKKIQPAAVPLKDMEESINRETGRDSIDVTPFLQSILF